MSETTQINIIGHVPLEYDIENCSIVSDLKDKPESEHGADNEQQIPTKET